MSSTIIFQERLKHVCIRILLQIQVCYFIIPEYIFEDQVLKVEDTKLSNAIIHDITLQPS